MSVNEITGPHKYDDPTVNGEKYLHSFNNYFPPMLKSVPLDTLFQQDGAPPNYSRKVRALLDEKLPDL